MVAALVTFKRDILHTLIGQCLGSVVYTRENLEHSVGLEVEVRVTDVLAEGETWLSRTGGISGLSGSDVVLSGPTEGEEQRQAKELHYLHTSFSSTNMNEPHITE